MDTKVIYPLLAEIIHLRYVNMAFYFQGKATDLVNFTRASHSDKSTMEDEPPVPTYVGVVLMH
jgi:hypothetical protein